MQSSHSEFGQAGYSQQYGYPTALQSVSANPAHDMSKQVSAGQPGMYQSSGGMPSGSQHHHQPNMTGPAPSPQPSPIVNPSQQLNRAHVANIGYYTRNNVPRTVPNIGRNNMSTVVNQAQQQAASQYSHMQLVTSHPMHPAVAPLIVNPTIAAPMYQHNRYPAAYPGAIMNTPPQIYSPYSPSYFNNTPHGAANGYYPHHQISYAMNSQQVNSTQATAPVAQPTKKRLAIIDPLTGKDILQESVNEETAPTKEETSHNDAIGLQFATQVAQTLGTEKKSEVLETSSIESNTRIVQSTVICPTPEIETVSNSEISDGPNMNNINETFDDSEPITYFNKEQDISNVVDSFETKSSIDESLILDPQNVIMNSETVAVTSSTEIDNYIIETNETDKTYYDIQELPEAPEVKSASPDRTVEEKSIVTIDENPPAVDSDLTSSNIRTEKNEAKKKTKKKKDFNRKGESKEGGEMDAFLDKTEEQPNVQVVSQVPVTSSSDNLIPVVTETIDASSPVPIVDSEILNAIPLPGESQNSPKTDDSDKEFLPEDSSMILSVENDTEDKENIEENNTQNKIVLKYTYKEDQWSPLNPEGKKQYDRDFLLQLQSQPMSLCKPSNLPNLDVIKDKAHIQRLTEVNRTAPMPMPPVRPFDPFMPQYARGGNALRPPHPAISRRSQQGRGDKKPKIISLPTNQNIKLHESENAWKPTHKSDKKTDEDLEEEELFRKIRGILNKLTPQKFQTLVEQVKELPIDTMKKLEGTINLIFEKAVDEPNFSVPYANMCKQLALIKVPLDDGQGVVNFRKLLLTKCQKEFEQDKSSEKKREDKIKAMKAAKDDEEKYKELQLEIEEEEKKMRMRQLGNIRFIGELFKLNMLIEPIMHECIKKLLAQGDEESLECLCRLLKTIGKELDEKGNKPRESNLMDSYFQNMQRIVEKRLTSSRVRFMLQDVIDLKKNNWIPRRDENNPKTIDQIHKEAEKEAREAQQAYQNINYSKRLPEDRRKLSGRSMGVSEDGWTPTSKSNKGSYSVVDPSKLKLTKPDEVESIRLGPGGKGPQSWGKGSSGGNRTSVDSDMKTALTNRYSALADQTMTPGFENRRGSQRSAASSRESSRGRNSQLPPTVRKTPSTSRERESLIETVKELNRNVVPEPKQSDAKKVESQINGKMAEPSSALALNGPDLSEEDIEKKTKPLIDEFLHNADFEEAEKCVMELASPSTVHYFIYYAINQVLERSSQTRYLLGQLLCSLVKKSIMTLEEYKKGLSGVLENIDDYAVDIPKIWEYMGDILEPMVEDKLPLSFLKDVLEPCIPSETAGKLVSAVLHCAAKKKGTVKLGELWKESGLQWSDFLGNSVNINEFISNHKLEFTVSQTKVVPSTEVSIEEIRTKLRELLENKEDNESIFDYIDVKVPPSAVSEPAFIRALAQEVHKAAITGTGSKCELDQSMLKKRIPLLTRYIDHNENLELQALYAVQHLMTDLNQPKGVLRQIFDILYDDDVITEETFKVWENSDDPAELEGKGVALNCVRGFFTWLREAEESGEEVEDE